MLSRFKSASTSFRAGFNNAKNVVIDTFGGFRLNSGMDMFWFQKKADSCQSFRNGTVDACVRLYSQTIGIMPMLHEVKSSKGEWVQQMDSKIQKLLLNPNDYECQAVFVDGVVNSLMFTGEAFIYVENKNGEPDKLHRMNPYGSAAHFVQDDNGMAHLLYTVNVSAQTAIRPENIVFPQNMIHIKVNAEAHRPLTGRSPITSAGASIEVTDAINETSANFFRRGVKPSGIISTNEKLTKEQLTQLREAFQEQSADMDAGGIPVLGAGMKFDQISMSSQDAQLISALRMGKQGICEAFGIPLNLIDQTERGDANLEALINQWLSTGLGFHVRVFEQELMSFFGMNPLKERINLDERGLIRMMYKDKIEAMKTGVQGGVLKPNEGRSNLGLGEVEGGDACFVQQQMIPLTMAAEGKGLKTSGASGGTTEDPEEVTPKSVSVDEALSFMKSLD